MTMFATKETYLEIRDTSTLIIRFYMTLTLFLLEFDIGLLSVCVSEEDLGRFNADVSAQLSLLLPDWR